MIVLVRAIDLDLAALRHDALLEQLGHVVGLGVAQRACQHAQRARQRLLFTQLAALGFFFLASALSVAMRTTLFSIA